MTKINCIFRVQNSINDEQKKEILILQRRMGQVKQEFVEQIAGLVMNIFSLICYYSAYIGY